MNKNEQFQQLQRMIQNYQPIKRNSEDNEYLCPSKYKTYQTTNELYLLNYCTDQQLTENDLQTISQFYNITYMSFDYLIFLYLLQYHPNQNTTKIIPTFIEKYVIKTNQEVSNIILSTKNKINQNEKDSFLKYIFSTFSISIGKRQLLKEEIMEKLLQLLYSQYPLYSQFITFLKYHQHYFLTKDQWNCLSSFSHIVFIPQQVDFYLQYTSENSYFYPVLFDEFFLYLKQLLLNHQISF